MKRIEKTPAPQPRVLGRRLSKELTEQELVSITGGTTSCSCGKADDCDIQRR